jgi:RNA 3'-terminal phosphate cyclase (ATP)
MIQLDGSLGEGGGQILRSALALSLITQQPFTIRNIRAKRPKPGLMRQHLACVHAAAAVCGVDAGSIAGAIEGANLGSTTLTFKPAPVQGGAYTINVGSAGSCMLVLQTVLWPLLLANQPSTLTLQGGTHNPLAPSATYLQHTLPQVLAQTGGRVTIDVQRHGFYPAGGGVVVVVIEPAFAGDTEACENPHPSPLPECEGTKPLNTQTVDSKGAEPSPIGRGQGEGARKNTKPRLKPLHLTQRGALIAAHATCLHAGVPKNVADRELGELAQQLGWQLTQLHNRALWQNEGPGNALIAVLQYEGITDAFTAFGERSVSAEQVARDVVAQVREYQASTAPVGEYLADQLMLPLALAGAGEYVATMISEHSRTNAAVIEAFLPVRFECTPHGNSPAVGVRVKLVKIS